MSRSWRQKSSPAELESWAHYWSIVCGTVEVLTAQKLVQVPFGWTSWLYYEVNLGWRALRRVANKGAFT